MECTVYSVGSSAKEAVLLSLLACVGEGGFQLLQRNDWTMWKIFRGREKQANSTPYNNCWNIVTAKTWHCLYQGLRGVPHKCVDLSNVCRSILCVDLQSVLAEVADTKDISRYKPFKY